MKKYFILLLVVLLPLSVNAMAYSETFDVGDSVTVGLKSDEDNTGFHVLKESQAGETTVTLIYDGVIEGSATVYDETNPDENHDASVLLDESIVGQKLINLINADGAKWRVETARLLNESDLNNLGITKDDNGLYEINKKYSFLAAIKINGLEPEMYNYWTSIVDESASSAAVYCVTDNASRSSDNEALSTLVSMDITSVTNNSKCAIRPVVVIDKAYILCNNTKTPTPVDTGVADYIIPLSFVLIAAVSAVVATKKKSAFQKI